MVGDLCVGFGVDSLRRHPSGYRLYLCQKYFVFVVGDLCVGFGNLVWAPCGGIRPDIGRQRLRARDPADACCCASLVVFVSKVFCICVKSILYSSQ